MLYPRITKLYMYKPPNDYTLNILRNDRLWAAKPEHFNDPFDDGNLKITKDFTEQDYLAATCRKYGKSDQWPREIVQYVDEILDADGNFTLPRTSSSEEGDSKAYRKKQELWSCMSIRGVRFNSYVVSLCTKTHGCLL